ncbi:MAG: hypothetical protein AAGI17_10065 [Planctomycetota bacterium]
MARKTGRVVKKSTTASTAASQSSAKAFRAAADRFASRPQKERIEFLRKSGFFDLIAKKQRSKRQESSSAA